LPPYSNHPCKGRVILVRDREEVRFIFVRVPGFSCAFHIAVRAARNDFRGRNIEPAEYDRTRTTMLHLSDEEEPVPTSTRTDAQTKHGHSVCSVRQKPTAAVVLFVQTQTIGQVMLFALPLSEAIIITSD